jgi:hypothetical protein
MGKSLTLERIVASLAVLSLNVAATGCSRSKSATPSAETDAPAAPAAVTIAPSAEGAAAIAAPAVATASAPHDQGDSREAAAVDAGREILVAPSPKKPSAPERKSSASCGAQGCSPDMKKLGK